MMPGLQKLGPYELRGEIGRGAMARVWRAYDPVLDREVAIKEPLFGESTSSAVAEEMGRRFVIEGRAAAKLNHPNIVTIHAADVYDGRPAIVMELVEGSTLGKLLEYGRMQTPIAAEILCQLLDAVGYAHDHGVVHRDIKPENVFVDKHGRVKLADFGIAHVEDNVSAKATVAGAVLGTAGYMSPEQVLGRPVDARSDLFSVGVVAYEMVAGYNPFGAGDGTASATVMYRIAHEEAPALGAAIDSGASQDIAPVIMMALQKDPTARPQSARAFRAMLVGSKADSAAIANLTNQPPGSSSKWLPYVAVVSACVIVLVVAFASATTGGGGVPTATGALGRVSSASSYESTAGSDDGDSLLDDTGDEEDSDALAYSVGMNDADATSVLEAGPYSYAPTNVLDGMGDTCWAEGSDDNGIGDSITISGEAQTLEGFRIQNGYQKTEELYYKNVRPEKLKVEADGQYVLTALLDDKFGTKQIWEFEEPIVASELTFTIESVYEGTEYDDCCISEIEVF